MANHSRFSPSAAHRWVNCPASIKASENYPDSESQASIMGTKAHALAEKCLINNSLACDAIDDQRSRVMASHVQKYLDYVESLRTPSSEVYIEHKLDFSNYIIGGFGTVDCLIIDNIGLKVAHIIDLKYGNYLVGAKDNYQLMLYALGVLCEHPTIDAFTLHIAQPRRDNFNSWAVSADTISLFGIKAGKSASNALLDNPAYKVGDYCSYCKHSFDCKELNKPLNI